MNRSTNYAAHKLSLLQKKKGVQINSKFVDRKIDISTATCVRERFLLNVAVERQKEVI